VFNIVQKQWTANTEVGVLKKKLTSRCQ